MIRTRVSHPDDLGWNSGGPGDHFFEPVGLSGGQPFAPGSRHRSRLQSPSSPNPSLRRKHLNLRTRVPLPDHPPWTCGPPFDHREGMARWPSGQRAVSSDRGERSGGGIPGPIHSRHQGVLGGPCGPLTLPLRSTLTPPFPGPVTFPIPGNVRRSVRGRTGLRHVASKWRGRSAGNGQNSSPSTGRHFSEGRGGRANNKGNTP